MLAPITIVGGEHIGCFELFAKEGIRSTKDLKGKNVGVHHLGSGQHVSEHYVGLNPVKDINWVTSVSPKPMELFPVPTNEKPYRPRLVPLS